MEQTPPLPVAKSFLVCRELLQDKKTQQYILLGPFSTIFILQVPAMVSMSVYAEMTCCRGNYIPSVELRDLEDQVVWSYAYDKPFADPNPLAMGTLTMFPLNLYVPRHGKYDLVLLLNKVEIARRPLWVSSPQQPAA